ncbi:MAG TPA: TonB-dependent receptor plug domain-containing protein, partial [Longimicrobium sp.]|nr:TonB-dependent receptor plug domain-containing protein [Longimicrobium sp.]
HPIRRSIAVLLLLGSAACAHDGMLAPEVAPEPREAALTAAPPSEPAATPAGRSVLLRICGTRFSAPGGLPLYVVDGVMLDSLPEALDPMDIDRIEVVKGAAAVRLYGPRAEHGLVQITTRSSQGLDGT